MKKTERSFTVLVERGAFLCFLMSGKKNLVSFWLSFRLLCKERVSGQKTLSLALSLSKKERVVD